MALPTTSVPRYIPCPCDGLRHGRFGCELWNPARKRGAELLWRLQGNAVLLREKTLAEGSYLSTVYPSSKRQGRRRRGVRVRVVEEQPG